MTLGAVFTLMVLLFQVLRTFLWWRYKPYPLPSGRSCLKSRSSSRLTTRGPWSRRPCSSAVASDYPADRLEIICIDDGSKDDTWRIYRAGSEDAIPI
jgi:hyaluronan synthase